jgi:hypothetical protein
MKQSGVMMQQSYGGGVSESVLVVSQRGRRRKVRDEYIIILDRASLHSILVRCSPIK